MEVIEKRCCEGEIEVQDMSNDQIKINFEIVKEEQNQLLQQGQELRDKELLDLYRIATETSNDPKIQKQ